MEEFNVNQLLSEEVIDLQQARAEFETLFGESLNQSTVNRWVHDGYAGVKLEALRLGKKFKTSKQAIKRFVVSINKE
jgi:hypothetical protein